MQSVTTPSVLDPTKLNIVGETHTESNARRAEEKSFSQNMTQSFNYWTEADFPLLFQTVGTRAKRSGGSAAPTAAADLMEYRAVHAATMLIKVYETLATQALTPSNAPPASQGAALKTFVDQDLRNFITLYDRIDRAWRLTGTTEVDQAVQGVFNTAKNIYMAYFTNARAASTLSQKIVVTSGLAQQLSVLVAMVPRLAEVIGGDPKITYTYDTLAKFVRERRSLFMGMAVGNAGLVGVWKVGDLHVEDLLGDPNATPKVTPRVNVAMQGVKLIRKVDFNRELQAWMATQPPVPANTAIAELDE